MKESVDQKFSNFLSEAVSVTISGDTTDEVEDMMTRIKGKLGIRRETYGLSDRSDAVTLGARFEAVGVKSENMVISNDDMKAIMAENTKENKFVSDKNGNPRVFILRTSAAAEARAKNGKVIKNQKGKGYIVKLNEENQNVQMVEESIQEERSKGTSGGSTYLAESCGCTETSTKDAGYTKTTKQDTTKTTSEEKKAKSLASFKAKVIESIDKGIEPGMSMAAGGESGGRDMGEKINKRGKASPVAESGGETMVTTMSDQRENELKKQGINLSTFRAKNPV